MLLFRPVLPVMLSVPVRPLVPGWQRTLVLPAFPAGLSDSPDLPVLPYLPVFLPPLDFLFLLDFLLLLGFLFLLDFLSPLEFPFHLPALYHRPAFLLLHFPVPYLLLPNPFPHLAFRLHWSPSSLPGYRSSLPRIQRMSPHFPAKNRSLLADSPGSRLLPPTSPPHPDLRQTDRSLSPAHSVTPHCSPSSPVLFLPAPAPVPVSPLPSDKPSQPEYPSQENRRPRSFVSPNQSHSRPARHNHPHTARHQNK